MKTMTRGMLAALLGCWLWGFAAPSMAACTGTGTFSCPPENAGGLGEGQLQALTAINGKLGSAPGSSTGPDLRPTTSTITARDIASSSASGFNSVSIVTGAPTASSYLSQAINGMSAVRVQVTGTWTGTLSFEASIDSGTTWVSIPLRGTGTVYTSGTTTGNGDFGGDISGLTNFRVRSTAVMTGTANVAMTFSPSSGFVQVLNPVRIVDNGSGQTATVKAASTAPATTDTSVVTTQVPATPASSAALVSNQVVKASAGNLTGFQVSADSTLYAAAWWIMIFDATSLPGNGAVTPKKCYAMPAGSLGYGAAWPTPIVFATGIVIGVSTTGCFTITASVHAFISGDAQ